jgi:hypothetical protein
MPADQRSGLPARPGIGADRVCHRAVRKTFAALVKLQRSSACIKSGPAWAQMKLQANTRARVWGRL